MTPIDQRQASHRSVIRQGGPREPLERQDDDIIKNKWMMSKDRFKQDGDIAQAMEKQDNIRALDQSILRERISPEKASTMNKSGSYMNGFNDNEHSHPRMTATMHGRDFNPSPPLRVDEQMP